MKRRGLNWDAILADSLARGLCTAEVAREQGVSHVTVHRARTARGVALVLKRSGERPGFTALWDARFSESPPESVTLNEFCSRFGCGAKTADLQASRRGLRFRRRASADDIWRRCFADGAGLSLNAFCRRYSNSPSAATTAAKRLGHKFAPSAARAAR